MYRDNPFGNPDGARADLREIEYSFITEFPYELNFDKNQSSILNKRVKKGLEKLLAQALLGDPKVVILDEPTAGLDPKERIRIRNFISSLSRGRIILLATHIVGDIESISDQILMMKHGHGMLVRPIPCGAVPPAGTGGAGARPYRLRRE